MQDKRESSFGNFEFDTDVEYLVNDIGTSPFYTWTPLKDDKLEEHTQWLDRLKPGKTIIFTSSSKKADDKKIIEDTGYVVPRFRFIEHLIDEKIFEEEHYANVLSSFHLNDEDSLSLKKIQQISAFRDSLLVQIIRQADHVSAINQQILDVLKVYYYEIIMAILSQNDPSSSEDSILDRAQDQLWILTEIILRGAKFEFIISQLEKWKIYSGPIYWESTYNGLNKYCALRNNVLKTALTLAKSYLPYESLLEDIFLNNRIKKPEAFDEQHFVNQVRKLQGDQYFETAFEYYLKEQNWGEAFVRISKEMKKLGLTERHKDEDSLKAAYYNYLSKQKNSNIHYPIK